MRLRGAQIRDVPPVPFGHSLSRSAPTASLTFALGACLSEPAALKARAAVGSTIGRSRVNLATFILGGPPPRDVPLDAEGVAAKGAEQGRARRVRSAKFVRRSRPPSPATPLDRHAGTMALRASLIMQRAQVRALASPAVARMGKSQRVFGVVSALFPRRRSRDSFPRRLRHPTPFPPPQAWCAWRPPTLPPRQAPQRASATQGTSARTVSRVECSPGDREPGRSGHSCLRAATAHRASTPRAI